MSLKHEVDKVLVYERAGLLFVFNFHSNQSFTDYRVGVEMPGQYTVALTTDEPRFGGFDNGKPGGEYFTTPLEWNGRKNFLQVSSGDTSSSSSSGFSGHYVQVYIPSRTALVLALVK